jgi:hypothetical protein
MSLPLERLAKFTRRFATNSVSLYYARVAQDALQPLTCKSAMSFPILFH